MSEVPFGWSEAALGDVCKIVSGATPKTGVRSFWGGPIAWLTPNDMSRDRSQTLQGGDRSLTHAGLASCSTRLVPAGSVIVSSRAPIGYVAIAGREMCTNQGCKTAIPPDFLDSKYLYWYLLAAKPDLDSRASGTTFKEISAKRFAETQIRWPGLSEQRRIVEIIEDHFSRLDAAANYASAAQQRTKTMVSSARQLLVAAAACNSTTYTLGELASVGTGTTPQRSEPRYYAGGNIPWITSGDLSQGDLLEANRFVTDAALAETSLKLYPTGTLLIAMYGEGKTRGTVAELGIPATTNQACAAVDVRDEALKPWIRLVLEANYSALRRLAAGGVQPNLNLSLVRAIQIPIPDNADRERLMASTTQVIGGASSIRGELEPFVDRVAKLRSAVFAAAFSGRLAGRSTDDEVIEEVAG
ncbi:restriction endonuclease subunit S [Allobranchiibius sp. CTAmp26]|uniref:restriction endonuclease subunit S n=1 Tax=Allobranchiibius sp. CTAmp26 TaxID=2815214 RepID=UPI001AA11BEC|nr:restriction endonuclease subunit S [Allobranchiibius sp. CTAmp26]MBO1756675.1 restriction endonuclease subunit S [Allobranchiibius sp. CTAmp26]